jgi:integrase
MDFLRVKNYSELIENQEKKWIENNIKNFLVYLRNERKISYKSASHYLDAIKKFYYVNSDYDFKWKLIKMYLGDDDDVEDNNSSLEDRPYTKQEIQTMLNTATDIRVKIIILLISSSGIRMGAIPILKLRNLTRIEKYNLYQLTVYEKSKKSNYKTFCSLECSSIIDTYLNYRKHAGEELKSESPLIREQFNPSDKFKVNNPKSISSGLIKYLVNEVLTKYSTLKEKIEYDYENKRKKIGKNNSTALTHSLPKFFDTECRKAGVYPDIVELLMGHKLPGVRFHYFKPDIQTLLEGTVECKGYVTAINDLTIDESNRLQKQVQELKEQDDYQKYVIDKKMKEKDEQIKALQDSIKFLSDTVNRALLADPENKIITAPESDGMIVKGIELKPEINNKVSGKVIPSNGNNKKK